MASPQEILDAVSACFCALLPDDVLCCAVALPPILATCCPGQAWVRIVAIEPVPVPGLNYLPCGPMNWRMELELGLARCAPDDCGNPVGNACCAAEAEIAALLLQDRALMMRAVSCCSGLSARDVTYGRWYVDSTTGGCVSGTLKVLVTFEDSCAC